MSYASDAKLKELDGKVRQLEAMVIALKVKLEAVEALTIPRVTRTMRRTSSTKDDAWPQETHTP